MSISIRDPKAGELARELAELRRTNMSEAIVHALREQLQRERGRPSLGERLRQIAQETAAMAGPNPREVTKEEIDDLWGQ
jgi:antitoxin VapB